ncbi:MAG: hypothetical protein JWM68_1709, partial [Verrucomicrobiales bacterium]|nr:hypothetical protein [Verrucomicrobiales bacterium]
MGLMCNLLAHPELTVIRADKPRFGWIVNDTRRGAKQSAYQIILSASSDAIKQNRGDLWDSGKMISSQSVDVPFAGDSLVSSKTYFWRVRTWDAADHASPFSRIQEFRIGEKSKPGVLPPKDFANRYPN